MKQPKTYIVEVRLVEKETMVAVVILSNNDFELFEFQTKKNAEGFIDEVISKYRKKDHAICAITRINYDV